MQIRADRRLVWLALVLLAGCAPVPEVHRPPPQIPEAFLQAFPEGDQARTLRSIKVTFDRDSDAYYAILERYRHYLRGDETIVVVFAIDPSGHVAGETLLQSTESQPEMEAEVLYRIKHTEFGPSPGTGYFVTRYPFYFRLRF